MHSEKLDFCHRDILYKKLKVAGVSLSEYSFSNLYLFRSLHEYEIIFDREIFIKGKTYDGFPYLMPTVDVRSLGYGYIVDMLKEKSCFLFPIAKEWLDFFTAPDFEYSYEKGDLDYVYSVEKMSQYKGRRLHKKRNLLKQFLSLYEYKALPLVKERMEDAISILNEWQKDTGFSPAETDFYPCMEALKMYDELLLCGGIYYVQKEPAGFIIGEELNGDMFAVHFAKAKKRFKGIYQYMYNSFAKILPPKYKYFNFEQDLGKEPLRIAKASYMPDKMLKKFRVRWAG